MVEASSSLAVPMTLGLNYPRRPYMSRDPAIESPFLCSLCGACLSSGIIANRWRARVETLKIASLSDGRHSRPRSIERGKFTLHAIGVAFMSIQERKGFDDEESIEHILPPRGSVAVEQSSDFQRNDDNKAYTVSKRNATGNEIRVQYLEERDEEILSRRLLGLSRSNKVRSALELFKSMEFSCLKPSLHSCNSLLSCLMRHKRLDDALIIFEFLKSNNMTSGHSFSLILKGIADISGCDAAIATFVELERNDDIVKEFDIIVYNTMLTVFAKKNDWVGVEIIWRRMKDGGHVGTTVSYRLIVCTFVRCGQNDLALDAYREMVKNGLNPSEDTMQAIIGACSKEGKSEFALKVFQNMHHSGIKPNIVTFNSLINALGKEGKIDVAFKVYDLMKSSGHIPDSYTWNSLISGLYNANRHADALRLFERIQKENASEVNLHLYNSALLACQRLGLWDRALQLLWQMEALGLPVSIESYNHAIRACEVARRPKVALQVYKHMVHKKHEPDTFTLLSLLRCCIWGSLWDDVEEVLNSVPANGSLYNAAIQGLCLRGKVDTAKELYTKMREFNLKPDGKTRALMLQNLSKW